MEITQEKFDELVKQAEQELQDDEDIRVKNKLKLFLSDVKREEKSLKDNTNRLDDYKKDLLKNFNSYLNSF